jgi:hypothetical protein
MSVITWKLKKTTNTLLKTTNTLLKTTNVVGETTIIYILRAIVLFVLALPYTCGVSLICLLVIGFVNVAHPIEQQMLYQIIALCFIGFELIFAFKIGKATF